MATTNRFGISIALIGLVLLAIATGVRSVSASTDLLPDLQPFQAADLSLETKDGITYLRFSTTSWNRGAGPLELFVKSSEEPTDGKQKVYQRVYLSDGGSRELLAGEFVFHPDHNHFHFDGYANYELRDASGSNRLREGSKTSFCLMDTDRIDHRLPGAPKRAHYTTCGATVQGISVGWGDEYGAHLPGQEFDVTALPAGEYRLLIDIDPWNSLLESDSTNNRSELRIYLDVVNNRVEVISETSGDSKPGNGNRPR